MIARSAPPTSLPIHCLSLAFHCLFLHHSLTFLGLPLPCVDHSQPVLDHSLPVLDLPLLDHSQPVLGFPLPVLGHSQPFVLGLGLVRSSTTTVAALRFTNAPDLGAHAAEFPANPDPTPAAPVPFVMWAYADPRDVVGGRHCRYCYSAAPPSSFSRCFNRTGEEMSAA